MSKIENKNIKLSAPHVNDPALSQALTKVYKDLNDLKESVHNFKGKEESDAAEGKEGDIRVVKSSRSGSYILQIRGDENWLEDKTAKYTSLNPDVDVAQEQSKQALPSSVGGLLPPPDYDSGFFEAARGKQYVTGATTGVVPDDSFIYVAADVVGIPALASPFGAAPSLIQVQTAPYNVKSFSDAMEAKVLVLDWQNHYYGSSGAIGVRCQMTSPEHISFNTADEHIYFDNSSGGNPVRTEYADFHDAFDVGGTQDKIMLRIKIWK